MDPTRLPSVGSPHIWNGPAGSLEIRFLTPAVMLFLYKGRITGDAVAFFKPIVAKTIAAGLRPEMYVDCGEMTGYDPSFRPAIERWATTVSEYHPIHIFFRSKIISMLIAVACMVTGSRSVKPYEDRKKFEDAVLSAVRASAAA